MSWQFEYGFVPETETTCRWAQCHPTAKALDVDRSALWKGYPLQARLVERLNRLLPKRTLLSPSRTRWEDGNGSYVDVLVDGEQLVDIAVTIDLRMPCLFFVSELALLANERQWLAMSIDGKIFRPTVRRFLVEIRLALARRRVQMPAEFAARKPTLGKRHSRRNMEGKADRAR